MSVTVTFVGSGDAFGAGGRFQTCILVDAPGTRFVIDFGASSLIALNKMGINHNSIDTIILTHIHGDHCGGIPFMLMDAMLGAKRQRPLTIVGPRETEKKLDLINEVMMPGIRSMTPKFELKYLEIDVMSPTTVGSLSIVSYPAQHTAETNPTSIRIIVAGKVISYTGDSAWTRYTPEVAEGADLFICECYFYGKPVRYHMNYPDIKKHQSKLKAKRTVLTHFSREMILHKDNVPEETAYDGLAIEL